MNTPEGRVAAAYQRLVRVAEDTLMNGARPGSDVSMFRALRELHSVLGTPEGEQFDDRRLVCSLLFNGLAYDATWSDHHMSYGAGEPYEPAYGEDNDAD